MMAETERVGYFESAPGVKSMGRLQAFCILIAGMGTLVMGAIYKEPSIFVVGSGILAISAGLKFGQKVMEK